MQQNSTHKHSEGQNKQKALLFFRLLLNRYFNGKSDSLAKLLPQEEMDALNKVTTPLKDPTALLFQAEKWLQSYDPTWYFTTLHSLEKPLKALYRQILPEAITSAYDALKNDVDDEDVQLKSNTSTIASCVKEHLFFNFYKLWQEQNGENLPIAKELVDGSDLLVLLELSKTDLLDIADLLSMHILVDEVRHIVDKRVLQALSQVLTPKQQHYLRKCLRQKTKHHAPTFSLRERLVEPKKLPSFLHKQGLKRMAVALSGENNDLIWYIMHTLDTGRAKYLQAEIQQEPIAHGTKLAQLEILQILQFLKTG